MSEFKQAGLPAPTLFALAFEGEIWPLDDVSTPEGAEVLEDYNRSNSCAVLLWFSTEQEYNDYVKEYEQN